MNVISVFILSMNVISIQHKTSNLTKNKEKRMTCQKKNNNKYYFLKNNQQVFDIIVNGPLKFATSNQVNSMLIFFTLDPIQPGLGTAHAAWCPTSIIYCSCNITCRICFRPSVGRPSWDFRNRRHTKYETHDREHVKCKNRADMSNLLMASYIIRFFILFHIHPSIFATLFARQLNILKQYFLIF